MSEHGEWNRKGATLSDVTAEKEYGVTRDFILKGIRAAELPRRPGWRLCAGLHAGLTPRVADVRPEGGARCVSSARRDLCGGRGAILVPTATLACALQHVADHAGWKFNLFEVRVSYASGLADRGFSPWPLRATSRPGLGGV